MTKIRQKIGKSHCKSEAWQVRMFCFLVRTSLAVALLSMSLAASSSHSELLNIAVNAIARATSSSQVLSLDLTSVIIMLVLKIVIAFVQWVNGATSARFLSKNMRGVEPAAGGVLEYAFGEKEMVDCFGR